MPLSTTSSNENGHNVDPDYDDLDRRGRSSADRSTGGSYFMTGRFMRCLDAPPGPIISARVAT